MKITNALWATAMMAGAVSASAHHRRAHHHPLMKRSLNDTNEAGTCLPQCTTYVTSYLVDVEQPTPAPAVPAPTSTVPVEVVTVSPVPENPVVEVTVCPTPGTYTIPATTVTVTQTTAVCVGTTTEVPAGTHTVGGVTTVVTESTTVVCPVATTKTVDGTVTSVVEQTTYVCPSAGTYTIGPVTTAVPTGGPITVPSVSVVKPGTYCHEEIVTVIDVTNYVAVCPLTTVEVTQTVVPVAETPAPEPTKETEAPAPVKETPEAVAPVVKPHGGKHYAITYSQYNDDSTCKSAEDVDADIADIAKKGFGAIRLYSPECDSLITVGGACKKYGVQIILGVFIKAGGVTTADKEVEAIKKWNQWGNISLVVIGNEAIFQGFCTAEELAAYITKVGSEFKSLGYHGHVTTTEPVNIIEQYADVLCPAVDVVGCNIHPFFDPNVKPSDAGKFLKTQLGLVKAKCNKPAVVLEAGWPSKGNQNGAAVPGKAEQAEAIRSIQKEGDENIVYFTYRNDKWKKGMEVEQNFGCGDLF
jgi:exo-beta-1,3-glucanase (GH17 family)